MQILLSHSPRFGDVHVILHVILLLRKFKMATMLELHNFLLAQKRKKKRSQK